MKRELKNLTTQSAIEKMLSISDKVYNENAILRDIKASYDTHNSLTDEQIILFKTIVRELKLKAKGINTNIGFAKIKDTTIELKKTEIMLPAKNLHQLMSKENTIKTTYGGKKNKYIPCTIAINDGVIYLDYNSKKKASYKHTYTNWNNLTKSERRVIKTEVKKRKNKSERTLQIEEPTYWESVPKSRRSKGNK